MWDVGGREGVKLEWDRAAEAHTGPDLDLIAIVGKWDAAQPT